MANRYVIRNKTNQKFLSRDGQIVYAFGSSASVGGFDTETYEAVIYDGDLPTDSSMMEEEVRILSFAETVKVGRESMLATYQAAPLELRGLFSTTVTEINGLLDLGDYELALLKAQAVDTSAIQDAPLKASADEFKALFVGGLQNLIQP